MGCVQLTEDDCCVTVEDFLLKLGCPSPLMLITAVSH